MPFLVVSRFSGFGVRCFRDLSGRGGVEGFSFGMESLAFRQDFGFGCKSKSPCGLGSGLFFGVLG